MVDGFFSSLRNNGTSSLCMMNVCCTRLPSEMASCKVNATIACRSPSVPTAYVLLTANPVMMAFGSCTGSVTVHQLQHLINVPRHRVRLLIEVNGHNPVELAPKDLSAVAGRDTLAGVHDQFPTDGAVRPHGARTQVCDGIHLTCERAGHAALNVWHYPILSVISERRNDYDVHGGTRQLRQIPDIPQRSIHLIIELAPIFQLKSGVRDRPLRLLLQLGERVQNHGTKRMIALLQPAGHTLNHLPVEDMNHNADVTLNGRRGTLRR